MNGLILELILILLWFNVFLTYNKEQVKKLREMDRKQTWIESQIFQKLQTIDQDWMLHKFTNQEVKML